MRVVNIIENYYERFKVKYGNKIDANQWSALNAMLGCRSGQYGYVAAYCDPCGKTELKPQSCGHRSCPQCQHHTTVQWLDRQMKKLLPVDYYMVTFTLPKHLRSLAMHYPEKVYALLFQVAQGTLRTFGLNDKQLSGEFAMIGVLHTHSRRLDYHPHIHFIVPNGAVSKQQRLWRTKKGNFLFKNQNLAKVFRARLLKALKKAGFICPKNPEHWVVDCKKVGNGLPAIKYLSRYLYRGVISDRQIINDDGEQVTFSYTQSGTGKTMKRSLPGEQFIKLLLKYVLPKGLRRVRDYGFLHGNAKKMLQLLQLILKAKLPLSILKTRPAFKCKICQSKMRVIGFIRSQLIKSPG